MLPQLTDDQTLCLAANSRREGQELSELQRTLLRLVAHYERVADVIGASGLPRSVAERELLTLLQAGWLARLEPVEIGNSSRSVELAVSSGTPTTAHGYGLLDEGVTGGDTPNVAQREGRSALRHPSLAPSTARLGTNESGNKDLGSRDPASKELGSKELGNSPAQASPAVGVSRVLQVKAVLGEQMTRGSGSGAPTLVPSTQGASPGVSSRPPMPASASTLQDFAWTQSSHGAELSDLSRQGSERRISDVEGKRVSRPVPLVSEIQGLRPEPVIAQQAVGAGPPSSGEGMLVGKLRVPRPGELKSLTKAEKSPGAWEKEDRLPSVRINRKPSPPTGLPAAHRVVTVGARDATSDAPVAPAADRELDAPNLSPAPQPRGNARSLLAGLSPRQRTPGEMPAVRDDADGTGSEAQEPNDESAAAALRAAPNRELGRTLLGGITSDVAARAGTSAGSGEVRSPSARVGISRMVVVGKSDPALAASPAAPAGPQTARIPAPPTLLGVRAPTDVDLALPSAGNVEANDSPANNVLAGDPLASTLANNVSFEIPAANQTAELEADENLDHYEVIERLAMGGNGVVYRVRDPHAPAGEYLALKVLRQGQHKNPEAVSALTLEAKLMAALDHPNLVQLHDFGHENDEPFLLMECIDGLTMSELLHHPVSLPLDVGLIILQDALEALDYVHNVQIDGEAQRGVIHCDVSPQNLLVGRDGRTRLIDFGTSRSPGSPIGEQVVRCKPRYASPELLAGEAVDATTDVFAVGAVLFQLLCKQPAFSADPARRKRESLVPNPSRLNSRAPTRFDPICQRALDADRSKRYSTAREMLDELNQAVELSGIVLRRERVHDWVQRAMQAREGEVQLGPEEVQELLAEGKRTRRASSSDNRQALQTVEREHTRDLHSSPESTPISTLPPAAETMLLPRSAPPTDGGLPAKLRQWLTAAALVVAGAVVSLALFSPTTFQSLISPAPSGDIEPGAQPSGALPSTQPPGAAVTDAIPTNSRTLGALLDEGAAPSPDPSGAVDSNLPSLGATSDLAAPAPAVGTETSAQRGASARAAAPPKAAPEGRPSPVRRASPPPEKPARPPVPVASSSGDSQPQPGAAAPDPGPALPDTPSGAPVSSLAAGDAPPGTQGTNPGGDATAVESASPVNSAGVTP